MKSCSPRGETTAQRVNYGVDATFEQPELFATAPYSVPVATAPGFSLRPEYITSEEENSLLADAASGPWQNDYRRRIQQYGLGYGGERGAKPTWIRDFPDWLKPLAKRVAQDAGFGRFPENCVINEYIPPQGIAPHKDYAAFGPTVACVSLGSHILLDLIQPESERRITLHVPARSLWVMTGEARSQWQHGIAPRLTDVIEGQRRTRDRRVSITFRTAKDNSTIVGA